MPIPPKPPLFRAEGPQFYAAAYRHNAPFAKPGPYLTTLKPGAETQFHHWLSRWNVPFDPSAKVSDYDMRGYFLATHGAPHKPGHFVDTFKTPYDTTFSRESRYATHDNPFVWIGSQLVDRRSGRVVYAPPPRKVRRRG